MLRVANTSSKRPSIVQAAICGARAASGVRARQGWVLIRVSEGSPEVLRSQELAGGWLIFRSGVPSRKLRALRANPGFEGQPGQVRRRSLTPPAIQLFLTRSGSILPDQASGIQLYDRTTNSVSWIKNYKPLLGLLV